MSQQCIGGPFYNVSPSGGGGGGGTVTGTGAAGQVAFWTSPSAIAGDNDLFWDDVNAQFSVGATDTYFALGPFTFSTRVAFKLDDTNASALTAGGLLISGSGVKSPFIVAEKSNGSLVAPTTVAGGDAVWGIFGLAYDGTNNNQVSSIFSTVVDPVSAGSVPTDLSIQVSQGGSVLTAVYVNPDGEVGINNTSPTQRLDVSGSINVGNPGDSTAWIYKEQNPFIYIPTPGTLFVGETVGNIFLTGAFNFGFGYNNLGALTTGTNNVAIGSSSLNLVSTGEDNTAIGNISAQNITTGSRNLAIGTNALNGTTTQEDNIAIGYNTLVNNAAFHNIAIGVNGLNSTTTGDGNVGIGSGAGTVNDTGDFNVFLGYNSNASVSSLTNAIAIGANSVVDTSNSLVLGSGVNVGIGTTAPTSKLHIVGAQAIVENSAQTSLTSRTASAFPALVNLQRGNNDLTTPAPALANDFLGEIRFQGYDGTDYDNSGAIIRSQAAATFSITDNSAALIFGTTPSASTVPLERMRILPDGTIGVNTITIPSGTQMIVEGGNITASNTGDISLIATNSAGRACSIGAGGANSGFFFDNAGDFIIFSATKTNIEDGVLIGTDHVTVDGSTGFVGIATGAPSERLDVDGNIQLKIAGNKHLIKEGGNASMGVATLVAGTVTVSNTLITANTRIFLTGQNSSGTHGELTVSARTVGTDFTITSTSATDTRDVAWLLIEPAP